MKRFLFFALFITLTVTGSAQVLNQNVAERSFRTWEDSAGLNRTSSAAESNTENKHQFTIEIDPIPLFLSGFSAHFSWSPKHRKHMSYGIGFVKGVEFPEFAINANEENKDEGWAIKINQGFSLWAHYYFNEKNKGWFAGVQFLTQEIDLTNSKISDEIDRTNLGLLVAQGGYVWYPFQKENFFLRPWAGLAYQYTIETTIEPGKVDPDLDIGDESYILNALQPFATVHIGYKF